jgi:hypothetical protein
MPFATSTAAHSDRECGAGVLGERYVGGGNSAANAITMGRVAGMTIGREVKGEQHRRGKSGK